MRRLHTRSSWLIAFSALAVVAGCSPAEQVDSSEDEVLIAPPKSTSIAIIGAGPSGLSAALELKKLGYTKVTVFEKENRVGGKVYSYQLPDGSYQELGAVFASDDYSLVLDLAKKYGIPYTTYDSAQTILDGDGVRQTQESFLTSKYDTLTILGAVIAYNTLVTAYSLLPKDGFTWLPFPLPWSDLWKDFNAYAADPLHNFTPVAELARSIQVGFGYGYYENAPAAYFLKLLPWLVKVDLTNLTKPLYAAQYYTFPTGFQSIWQHVAAELPDVRLNSEVTKVERKVVYSGLFNLVKSTKVTITLKNGTKQDFDRVIISVPLNKVENIVSDLSDDQKKLFKKVKTERYDVMLFYASGLVPEEALFFHNNSFPERINHINVWANRSAASPAFVGYQIADRSITNAGLDGVLAEDVASQGGTFLGTALRQSWPDYFPHVSPADYQSGFYAQVDALQGDQNTYYVGGSLSFETVEHSASYARTLVDRFFKGL